MTTFYYTTSNIQRKDNTIARLASKHFDTEAEARAIYERKMAKPNVLSANLYRVDVYTPEEMVHPEKHPNGSTYAKLLSTYSRI